MYPDAQTSRRDLSVPVLAGFRNAGALERQTVNDLGQMLAGLSPELLPGVWVYAILPDGAPVPGSAAAVVQEAEGRTVVLRAEDAHELGLTPLFQGRWITLHVRSCLTAVGLTARVASELAQAGIPANMLAGFYHDHLIVPEDLTKKALRCLERLQAGAARLLSSTSPAAKRMETIS